jgi:hypothetical protein
MWLMRRKQLLLLRLLLLRLRLRRLLLELAWR